MELHVDEEMAQMLWDACHDGDRVALTLSHGGKVLQFQTGIRSVEIRHNNRKYAIFGQPRTVTMELVQVQPALGFDNEPTPDTSIRDAVRANP